jgi:hypothetical protein
MTHMIRIETNIPDNRKVELTLPADVPTGEAEVVVVIVPKSDRRPSTAQDLLNSEIVGMWVDRTDVDDSSAYARELRDRAWKRAQ